MFRLVHISDIHLAPLPPVSLRELMSKRITGYINWRANRALSHQPQILVDLVAHLKRQAPDHIAITGDLVNLALGAEFTRMRTWLEALGEPERVTITCGNHDAYVPGALKRALGIWQPYAAGDDGKKVSRASHYPVLRRRGEISLIVCNSGEATFPFMATGRFDKAQEKRLGALLRREEGRFRIVMIHHPPVANSTLPYQRLIGQKNFRKAIADHGAELVLHGHTHLPTRKEIAGKAGSVPVICVPAAEQAPGGIMPPAAYNLFEIGRADRHWQVGLKEFGYQTPGEGVRLLREDLYELSA